MPPVLFTSSSAQARIDRARRWLAGRGVAEEVLVVAASRDAASALLRGAAEERGAAFGWRRTTLGGLAAALAGPVLAQGGMVPLGRLPCEAVVARVVHDLDRSDGLGRFARIASGPGFARALACVLEELRMAQVGAGSLEPVAPELGRLLLAYEAALEGARLADRAHVFAVASRVAADPASRHPLLGLPLLLLDVPIWTAAESGLSAPLSSRSPDAFATAPSGDETTVRRLVRDAGMLHQEPAAAPAGGALARLQERLFQHTAPPSEWPPDENVLVLSAPGEGRESVEVARRLLEFARRGIRFDRMAVLLRSPEEYRPHLIEALGRAGVPAHFAQGTVHPDPAGRAFLALIACAAEGLSARRFAEYLSLGEVPDATPEGIPPAAPPAAERWIPPDEELVPDVVAEGLARPASPDEDEAGGDPDERPVTSGTLRAPRRWERLLMDAAVIGTRERWGRRLQALDEALHLQWEGLEEDDPAGEGIVRARLDLAALRAYALPLLDLLASLPLEADWGTWIEHLSALATRSLRRPERVLSVLAELAPMAQVGGVKLDEVRLVLSRRMLELAVPPAKTWHGKVFVAPIERARGLAFDVVCVPGLAERLFPRKIAEDPLLLDAARLRLGSGLTRNEDRLERERLALRIAAGAARRALVLSYPRLDLEQSRPRVPSFYALEALRAAEGRLPSFDALSTRAAAAARPRIGWPAPERPQDAMDEAEYDLALLEPLLRQDPREVAGTARYLLSANPHLGRALRSRARRWLRRFTEADGLVPRRDGGLAQGARDALAMHQLEARSYSPTALQHYASCPYRFFLQAVHRLAPREEPDGIDDMDPLQRGALFHDVQFAFFRRLEALGLLPLTPDNAERARVLLDEVLETVAEQHRDVLAPLIGRVWDGAIAAIRADLREWLRRSIEDGSEFTPWRFEMAFGMADRRERDPHSSSEPVPLDSGIRLRGSIDLVERHAAGRIRVTDHKTGKSRFPRDGVIDGGTSLQPVFYALAAEKLFPEATVLSGRLWYCTAAGGFEERSVPLDDAARQSAQVVADALRGALEEGFFPALPAPGACRFCDYAAVCGPNEERRTGRKEVTRPQVQALRKLRELP